jgi:DNA-binding MarR family transcriptional regulator
MARTLRGQVIDFTAIRRARLVEDQARHVDLVAAWQARTRPADRRGRDAGPRDRSPAEALDEAVERFALRPVHGDHAPRGRSSSRSTTSTRPSTTGARTRRTAAEHIWGWGRGLSNAAITWCSNIHPGKGPKGVLFCLADRATDHSGEDWTCYPSIADIMRWTDYSRAAVERNLQLLWREGYISRKRRRRADGRLGIYDYTLHREAEHREALKASRASVQDIDAAMENGVEGEVVQALGPHGVLQHGPCVISDGAMPQNDGQPCGKMRGQEPSREPSEEPSGRARDLAVLFGELERAVPARVLKFTDRDRAFQAFCDAEAAGVEVGQLAGCARRMAADPEFRSRKFASPLEVWIGKGQWRGWVADAGSVQGGAPGLGRWFVRRSARTEGGDRGGQGRGLRQGHDRLLPLRGRRPAAADRQDGMDRTAAAQGDARAR